MAAFADIATTPTGTVTITGLESGDTVTLYKIKKECYLLGALVYAGVQHTLKGRVACLVAKSCLTQW